MRAPTLYFARSTRAYIDGLISPAAKLVWKTLGTREGQQMERTISLAAALTLSAASREAGMRFAARLARDMSSKILNQELPAVGGPAALQLFATMLEAMIPDQASSENIGPNGST
jgi:hypothetical protein